MIENFSYLVLINIVNKILPFLTIPYIIKIVGLEKFGIIMFSYSFVAFFQILPKYAFNLVSTKYVSLHRDDNQLLSQYFWNIIGTKLFLFGITVVLFFPMVLFFNKFNQEFIIFGFSFFLILADILMPIWFFQGKEEMKYISFFHIVSKVIYTLLIFLLIQHEEDYILIPLLNVSSTLVLGIYAFYFIHKRYTLSLKIPQLKQMVELLKEGWHLFLSTLSVNLYTTVNTVLLGLLTNYTVVGIYSLAETIYGAYVKIIKIYNQVVYPHIACYANNRKQLIQQSKKFFYLYVVILSVLSFALLFSAQFIIELMFGIGHEASILVLQLLSLVILFEPLGGFFTAYLILKSEYKRVTHITFLVMLMSFVMIVPMILWLEEIGLVLTLLSLSIFQVLLNLKYNQELYRKSI